MEISFSFDKNHNKEHFKVNHPDILNEEIFEIFENAYLEFETQKHIKTIIGHTNSKKFLVLVGIFDKTKTKFRVITAYRAKRKHIIFWNNEVKKK